LREPIARNLCSGDRVRNGGIHDGDRTLGRDGRRNSNGFPPRALRLLLTLRLVRLRALAGRGGGG
jgi:hypothetical protein